MSRAEPTADGVPLMSWSDLLSRPRPTATEHITYGADPNQVIDLWMPAPSASPPPVVVMIHGGCWTAAVATHTIMDWAAADLAARGVAVWNIEYRGVDQPGGGYPGNLSRRGGGGGQAGRRGRETRGSAFSGPFVVLGHSAGGHLALWSAARRRLPRTSPLHTAHPMPVKAVIDIAGIPNLETDLDTVCGADPVHAMTGAPTPEHPDIYADTSPAHLAPTGVPTWVIHGSQDSTVFAKVGDAYADLARARGDHVQVLTPPGGHTEEISPGSAAWNEIAALVVKLAKP